MSQSFAVIEVPKRIWKKFGKLENGQQHGQCQSTQEKQSTTVPKLQNYKSDQPHKQSDVQKNFWTDSDNNSNWTLLWKKYRINFWSSSSVW